MNTFSSARPLVERPLRLLQVLEPSGGGSGRHFNDLCAGLYARGHKVTAIYSSTRAEATFVDELQSIGLDGVHDVPMSRAPSPSDLKAFLAINKIARDCGPLDIIHGHSSKAGALTRLPLPGRHMKTVYTPHAFRTMDPTIGKRSALLFSGIETALGKYLTDRVICVSPDEQQHALTLGIPSERACVVINGVKPATGDKRAAMRQVFDISGNEFVFGFVGRFSHQKAPERLISAFAMIAARFPEAILAMAGFGELEMAVRNQAAASGFADRIRIRTGLSGPDALQAFDCLVMPSRYEAMSYVMLEAEAQGLPMILSNVGGASAVLDDNDNGYLVANSDDPAELAAAMLNMSKPVNHSRLSLAAQTRRERHSLDAMVDQTISLYRDLIA